MAQPLLEECGSRYIETCACYMTEQLHVYEFTLKREENMSTKDLHTVAHSSFIHCNQN